MAGINLQSSTVKNLYKKYPECQTPNCKNPNLTIEHIVPKIVCTSFGMADFYNEEDNLSVSCKKCNAAKGHKLDPKNPKTVYLLGKLLNQWQTFYQLPRKKNVYAFRNLPVKHDTTVYKFISTTP